MKPLPTFARQRIDAHGPVGRVEAIQVRPGRRLPMRVVSEWLVGDADDHGRSVKRAATLFQEEHLACVAALLGADISFEGTRRNLLISGLNLEVAIGRVLHVGDARLALTARCHPCKRMDETFGKGAFGAMYGHGGWCARILEAALVRVGDAVRLGEVLQEVSTGSVRAACP